MLFSFYAPILPPKIETQYGRVWITLVTLFALYNAVAIPLRLGFADTREGHGQGVIALYVVDYIGDIVFILDILLNFRFAIISDGIETKDRRAVANEYCKTTFFFDVVASFPCDLFVFTPRYKHFLLRLPRLLRLRTVLSDVETIGV